MNTGRKRLCMILSLVMVLAILMPGIAQGVVFEETSSGFNGTILKSTYLFAAKSTKSSYRLASLAKGDVVPVSHWDGDYAVVTLSDGIGYVPATLVNVNFARAQIGSTNGAANIYKSMSGKNRSFHYDTAGSRVKVTGRIGSFYKVDVYGETYYMRVKDVSLTGVASSSTSYTSYTSSTGSGASGTGFVRDDAQSTKRDNSSATIFVASYGGGGFAPYGYNYGYAYNGWDYYGNMGYYGNRGYYGDWRYYGNRGYPYYSTGTLNIYAKDVDTNAPLAATFELVYSSGYYDTIGRKTSSNGASGTVTFSNLYPGSYTLTQTGAPTDYTISSSTWTVYVDYDGKVTVGGQSSLTVTNKYTPPAP